MDSSRICAFVSTYIYVYIHIYTDILYKISDCQTLVVLPHLGSMDNFWRHFSLTKRRQRVLLERILAKYSNNFIQSKEHPPNNKKFSGLKCQ